MRKRYLRPTSRTVGLLPAALLAESGNSGGYEDKPGQDDVIYEQRRRSMWDTNDWLNADKDKKEK